MGLSSDLISQFVKATKDNKKTTNETTVYGTIVYDDKPYVKLDGSDLLTPISTTTNVADGERVTVLIKNHMATVTGNISSPAARTEEVEKVGTQVSEFEIVMAYKVTTEDLEAVNASIDNLRAKIASFDNMEAVYADIEKLEAKFADIKHITAEDMEVINATIESLEATFGEFTDLSTEDLEAINAEIGNLKAYTADFTYVSAEVLEAVKASIKQLDVDKLSAKDADLKYANIDFANIGEAAIRKIFADTGIIKDLVVGDHTITGELVGVTIIGDLIKGGTVVADKLVILGEDGLYYKLNTDGVTTEAEQTDYNSLNGSIITAKSVTAEKVAVDDLVAFGATIGGFNITAHSLYSGVKESVDNTTVGVYMDSDAQFAIGDGNNYLRFYKDENDIYRLDISAASVMLSQSAKDIETAIGEVDDKLAETQDNLLNELDTQRSDYQAFLTKFSKYIRFMEDENGNPSDTAMTIGSGDSAITLEIDNEKGLIFKKNGAEFGSWDGVDFHTGNIVVEVNERAQFGNFAFVPRSDGSLSFLKVGG